MVLSSLGEARAVEVEIANQIVRLGDISTRRGDSTLNVVLEQCGRGRIMRQGKPACIPDVIRVLLSVVFVTTAMLHCTAITGYGQIGVIIGTRGTPAARFHMLDVTIVFGDGELAVAAQVVLLLT